MYICVCNRVTDKDIRAAVGEGANTMERLGRKLKVATCCGSCKYYVRAVLSEELGERSCDACLPLTTP